MTIQIGSLVLTVFLCPSQSGNSSSSRSSWRKVSSRVPASDGIAVIAFLKIQSPVRVGEVIFIGIGHRCSVRSAFRNRRTANSNSCSSETNYQVKRYYSYWKDCSVHLILRHIMQKNFFHTLLIIWALVQTEEKSSTNYWVFLGDWKNCL